VNVKVLGQRIVHRAQSNGQYEPNVGQNVDIALHIDVTCLNLKIQ